MLNFLYNFFLQDKTSIQQGLVISHQLPFDTSPHIVDRIIEVVDVEDIPIFHECCIFSQQHVLHILEVVFSHLVVHLILICLKTSQKLTFLVHSLKLAEQVLFSLLTVLSSSQER
jgi:hypothetical protein